MVGPIHVWTMDRIGEDLFIMFQTVRSKEGLIKIKPRNELWPLIEQERKIRMTSWQNRTLILSHRVESLTLNRACLENGAVMRWDKNKERERKQTFSAFSSSSPHAYGFYPLFLHLFRSYMFLIRQCWI